MTEEIKALLHQTDAILNGHFQLASGRHSPVYLEKFRILERPEQTEQLCRLIAERFRDVGAQLVVGPTTGGVIVGYEIARQLGVRSAFAERDNGGRHFGRGFKITAGERTLIVDDILTTGNSIRDVITALHSVGGKAIGVGVLVDRSGGRTEFGIPLYSCLSLPLTTYEPADCPLCTSGEPLIKT